MNTRIARLMKLHKLSAPADGEGNDLPGGDAAAAADTGTGAKAAGADEADNSKDEADSNDESSAGDKSAQPSDADAKLLKDMMKHKGKARELEAALAQVKEQLKAFEGLDPQKMRELQKEQEEAERKASEDRGEYDRLVKQMGERHAEEKQRLQNDLETIRNQGATLQQQIADLTVGSAFGNSRFVADELTLTPTKSRVIYGCHFEFKDGAVVGYDKPAGASERTLLVDAQGDALSFDEALRKLVEADPDREQLLRTKAKPGAGSVTTAKGAKKAIDASKAASERNLTPAEKIAAGLKSIASK